MGLDLRGAALQSSRAKDHVRRALDILGEIQAQVKAMGLSEYPRPANTPEPLGDVDIAALTNQELAGMLASYTGYASFLNTKVTEAEVAYKIATANMKTVIASLKASLYKDGTPKQEIDSRVKVSPEYIEQELELLKLYATKEILASHYRAYRVAAQAISRVIELRKIDWEQQHRDINVGRAKRPFTRVRERDD